MDRGRSGGDAYSLVLHFNLIFQSIQMIFTVNLFSAYIFDLYSIDSDLYVDVDVPRVRTSLQTLSSQELQTIEISSQNRETCANIYQSKAKNERNTLRIAEVRENTSGGRKDRKTTRKTSLSIWKK